MLLGSDGAVGWEVFSHQQHQESDTNGQANGMALKMKRRSPKERKGFIAVAHAEKTPERMRPNTERDERERERETTKTILKPNHNGAAREGTDEAKVIANWIRLMQNTARILRHRHRQNLRH